VPTLVWLSAAAVIGVAWSIGLDERVAASCMAVGLVCLAGSILGQTPIAVIGREGAEQLPVSMLASILFRGGTTVIGVVALIRLQLLDGATAAVCCGLWYLLMLAADVWVITHHVAVNFPVSTRSPERAI
jgi:hypothetical protein